MLNNPGKPTRRVLLAGATGLVGRELLAGLLADATVAEVITLGRRRPEVSHAKLRARVVDFAKLGALPQVDEVYLALGTTIQVAGSQAAFRAVDFEANLAVAQAAVAAGARRIGLVSALGANPASRVFYSRVKGELEAALRALPLQALVIARPATLAGDRESLGQPARKGEALALKLTGWLGPLLPGGWRSIAAADVAAALLMRLPQAQGVVVLDSAGMQGAATRRRR